MQRRLLLALVATIFVLAGCGASGGDDATPTTAAAPGGSASTITPATGGGTQPVPEPATTVTSQELEAILPTAEDIGPAYTVKADDGGDDEDDVTTTTEPGEQDPNEAAFDKACPKAKELDLMDDEVNEDEVGVEFETEDDRGIEVTLDPTPGTMDEDSLDQIIEAFNDCGVVEFEDPQSGPVKMELSAKRLDDLGDFGVEVKLDTELTLFGVPISVGFHGYLFSVDGVGVTVTSSTGLDPSTFGTVPGDDDLLPTISDEMETRVKTLTD